MQLPQLITIGDISGNDLGEEEIPTHGCSISLDAR